MHKINVSFCGTTDFKKNVPQNTEQLIDCQLINLLYVLILGGYNSNFINSKMLNYVSSKFWDDLLSEDPAKRNRFPNNLPEDYRRWNYQGNLNQAPVGRRALGPEKRARQHLTLIILSISMLIETNLTFMNNYKDLSEEISASEKLTLKLANRSK